MHLAVDFRVKGNAAVMPFVGCILPMGGAMACADSLRSLAFPDLLFGDGILDWVWGRKYGNGEATGSTSGPRTRGLMLCRCLGLGEVEYCFSEHSLLLFKALLPLWELSSHCLRRCNAVEQGTQFLAFKFQRAWEYRQYIWKNASLEPVFLPCSPEIK